MAQTILTKDIDWSTLYYGFNIPVGMQPALYAVLGHELLRGDKVDIKILIGDILYDATLANSDFDGEKFAKHTTDIVRVMYKKGKTSVALALQGMFKPQFDYLQIEKKSMQTRKVVKLPEDIQTKLIFSASDTPGVFVIEPMDTLALSSPLSKSISEVTFESNEPLVLDPTASVIERERIVKIRKIDQSIGENLKKLYQYKCQMTGEQIGEKYGTHTVEAHHIEYFMSSHNNDSSNIIILSPNYHRIIHKTNPTFNHKNLSFEFPNGLKEAVKLNLHL